MTQDTKEKRQADYRAKLMNATDAELRKNCNQYIWLAAYAANNPRSDFHWMVDYCYDECKNRDKVNIYQEEYEKIARSI